MFLLTPLFINGTAIDTTGNYEPTVDVWINYLPSLSAGRKGYQQEPSHAKSVAAIILDHRCLVAQLGCRGLLFLTICKA